mmetsp:Transcript_15448/g.31751  ORF Transcript_15448/g.31751 Transcript_15448/m.31751 type:complete len:245 (-) Transcript_15448:439-1173(-)|eukprot:CAMPEP_0171639376 /NCGR_PEP_ID=MMETSP0990-20121206/29683_1 /TAXON_ID=483369 /ORGANISM="non described non described, Strain CCMP2098" /LENGTH=244 /DNA_ID=CAMNT_0012213115 /DNA_START=70 /DNA_END=804 /DNA_ORIENTATION=-
MFSEPRFYADLFRIVKAGPVVPETCHDTPEVSHLRFKSFVDAREEVATASLLRAHGGISCGLALELQVFEFLESKRSLATSSPAVKNFPQSSLHAGFAVWVNKERRLRGVRRNSSSSKEIRPSLSQFFVNHSCRPGVFGSILNLADLQRGFGCPIARRDFFRLHQFKPKHSLRQVRKAAGAPSASSANAPDVHAPFYFKFAARGCPKVESVVVDAHAHFENFPTVQNRAECTLKQILVLLGSRR